MITDVFQVCCSFHAELFSDLEWNQAGIFTDNEEMKQIIFSSRFFYKILVSEGKRVGVHDESSNLSGGSLSSQSFWKCIFCKSTQIILKSGFSVFHEDNLSIDPGNFIESKITEELGRITFGVKKKVCIPS